MERLFARFLRRYENADIVVALKARFILFLCAFALVIIPILIVHTAYLHTNNPLYNYRPNFYVLAPEILLFMVVALAGRLLLRGNFALSAHLLFAAIQAVIWLVMFFDSSLGVSRLNTLVLIVAVFGMAPIVISRRAIIIPLYAAANILMLAIFMHTRTDDLALSFGQFWDHVADNSAAFIIASIISYNLFSITSRALRSARDSNVRLAKTNEELAAAMEELRATNEEFEAQNLELISSQDLLERSLEEKLVMLKEIHHRVKNNLQVISSLLSLQQSRLGDEELDSIFLQCRNRVLAISRVHEQMYQAGDFARVELGVYAKGLTSDLIRGYSRGGMDIKFDMEEVTLDMEKAIPCGLIINELVSNSLRHAFSGAERPGLSVSVRHERESGRCVVCVCDNGSGLPAGLDIYSAETMGFTLVRMLLRQLAGSLEIKDGPGAGFRVSFPVAARNAGGAA
ncbi:MAG TPA: histidine kinase dimerization/phosphoacceptor domain -containing protein [Spirochaetota bacterium]|nr:histidine kinase dimerization/phosphoacceptor domain -containing protein [Spirochaetota bacterium]